MKIEVEQEEKRQEKKQRVAFRNRVSDGMQTISQCELYHVLHAEEERLDNKLEEKKLDAE